MYEKINWKTKTNIETQKKIRIRKKLYGYFDCCREDLQPIARANKNAHKKLIRVCADVTEWRSAISLIHKTTSIASTLHWNNFIYRSDGSSMECIKNKEFVFNLQPNSISHRRGENKNDRACMVQTVRHCTGFQTRRVRRWLLIFVVYAWALGLTVFF